MSRCPLILGDEGAVTLVEVGAALQDKYSAGERCAVQPAVEHRPINHRTLTNMLDRDTLHGVKIGKEWRVSRAEMMLPNRGACALSGVAGESP